MMVLQREEIESHLLNASNTPEYCTELDAVCMQE